MLFRSKKSPKTRRVVLEEELVGLLCYLLESAEDVGRVVDHLDIVKIEEILTDKRLLEIFKGLRKYLNSGGGGTIFNLKEYQASLLPNLSSFLNPILF